VRKRADGNLRLNGLGRIEPIDCSNAPGTMQLLADDLNSLDAPPRLQPLRRRSRLSSLPWLRTSLLSAAAVAALVHFAAEREPSPPSEPAAIPLAALLTPPPAWRPVAQASPLYALEGIDPNSYAWEVRRHVSGAREDTLTFGGFGEVGYGRLQLVSGASEAEPASFYVDLARQAAEAGLSVVRSAQAAPIATKFGAAEIGAVSLAGASEESCLALRVGDPALGFRMRGWICGSAAQPATEPQLACLIDRLTLVGEDPALTALFAGAERRRALGCAPAPTPWATAAASERQLGDPQASGPAPARRPARAGRARRP
jgi:hypothetical protein